MRAVITATDTGDNASLPILSYLIPILQITLFLSFEIVMLAPSAMHSVEYSSWYRSRIGLKAAWSSSSSSYCLLLAASYKNDNDEDGLHIHSVITSRQYRKSIHLASPKPSHPISSKSMITINHYQQTTSPQHTQTIKSGVFFAIGQLKSLPEHFMLVVSKIKAF